MVRIKSLKRLKIEKVEFKFNEGSQGMEWKTTIPIKFEVTLLDSSKASKEKPDKKSKDETIVKPFVYQLRMHLNSELKTDQWGDVLVTTDLKEKKEIKLSGMLEAKK
jgi:hypothetical protein